MSHFTSNVFFFKSCILGWEKQDTVIAIIAFSEKPAYDSEKWKSHPVFLLPFPPSLPPSLSEFYKWPEIVALLLLTRVQDVWIRAGSASAGLGQPERMWYNPLLCRGDHPISWAQRGANPASKNSKK